MIPEIDIWRAAQLMLKHYGEQPLEESAARANEFALAGDAEFGRKFLGTHWISFSRLEDDYRVSKAGTSRRSAIVVAASQSTTL